MLHILHIKAGGDAVMLLAQVAAERRAGAGVSNITCQREGGTHDFECKVHHRLREQPGTGS